MALVQLPGEHYTARSPGFERQAIPAQQRHPRHAEDQANPLRSLQPLTIPNGTQQRGHGGCRRIDQSGEAGSCLPTAYITATANCSYSRLRRRERLNLKPRKEPRNVRTDRKLLDKLIRCGEIYHGSKHGTRRRHDPVR